MTLFGDFFGDPFGGAESMHRLLARTMGRQWGQGAMSSGTEMEPTDWEAWLRVRGAYMAEVRSYAEALMCQAFPDQAVYEYEYWEYLKRVFPAPPEMYVGERLVRLRAWCQTAIGGMPSLIEGAIENLTGAGNVHILEHDALACAGDPPRIYDFWTLVPVATLDDDDVRNDINEIVDRWKPAHTSHGASAGAGSGADNPYGGTREADASDITTPAWFKTGGGTEKTGRNLIQL